MRCAERKRNGRLLKRVASFPIWRHLNSIWTPFELYFNLILHSIWTPFELHLISIWTPSELHFNSILDFSGRALRPMMKYTAFCGVCLGSSRNCSGILENVELILQPSWKCYFPIGFTRVLKESCPHPRHQSRGRYTQSEGTLRNWGNVGFTKDFSTILLSVIPKVPGSGFYFTCLIW